MSRDQHFVLVVDDQEENCVRIEQMLAPLPVFVVAANTGAQALEYISQFTFSLILLDIDMPDMSGYQVLNRLASHHQGSEIPTILMGANFSDSQRSSGNDEISAADFIFKPINQHILRDKVGFFLKTLARNARLRDFYLDEIKIEGDERQGMLALGENGTVIYANPIAVALLKTTLPNLIGVYLETLLEFPHHSVDSCWADNVLNKACQQNKTTKVERAVFWRGDGKPMALCLLAIPLHRALESKGVLMTFSVLGKEAFNNEVMDALIKYDPLTRLPNRDSFMENCEVSLETLDKGKSLAVAVLGLDHFNYVNESLGHEVGDQLLISVASRLLNVIDNHWTLARLAGDEFVLLIPSVSGNKKIISHIRKLLKVYEEPFLVGGHEIFLSASVGIATYPACGINVKTLLRNADKALDKAKKSVPHKFEIYNSAMDSNTLEKLDLETELHYALGKNQLSLCYLPVVSAGTRSIEGIQALLNWQHPQRGKLPYERFAPIAEEAGLMPAIGDWALREACRARSRWKEIKGFSDLTVSIRVSLFQLLQQGFVSQVSRLLEKHALQSDWLELEIGESQLSKENMAVFVKVLANLKQLGVKIILDDFGSNYLSLNTLSEVDFHGVKISQKFINSASQIPRGHQVIKTIIDIAHGYDADVIAVDIESEEDIKLLQSHHCDKMQGGLFSRPLDEQQVMSLLQDGL